MQPLAASMQVVRAPEPGDADALVFESHPLPKVGDQDVLIRVGAAGLNRLDIFQREGRYPPPRGVTDVLGLEVAGEIVAVGKDVSRWQLGDQVCALLPGGGYAEYARAPADLCLPIPCGLSQTQAAALPEALYTVWSNVFQRVALQPGETLLVQGGASGIGTTAIQLARVFGHRVFATAGTAEKCQACVDLGAERAINYHSEDFVEVVREATQNRGVDVILDMVGGNYLLRELKALADDGRICLIAFLGGAKAEVNLAEMLRRRLTLTASTLRSRDIAFKAALARELEQQVWPHLASGAVKPVLHRTFAFSDVADAHRELEAGQHIGKIVLQMD
jgi:NADPH2:quinone reductase